MCQASCFLEFQLKDIINIFILFVTIFAIYIGPISAVKITKKLDDERAKSSRRYDIFHTLMKTRRLNIHPEHVTALNLIQLEFYENAPVMQKYIKYMELLCRDLPPDPKGHGKFFDERNDGLFDLIHAIGNTLGYNFDKRDLEKLSYVPQGWTNDSETEQILKRNLVDLLQGRKPLLVSEFKVHNMSAKFPPPP